MEEEGTMQKYKLKLESALLSALRLLPGSVSMLILSSFVLFKFIISEVLGHLQSGLCDVLKPPRHPGDILG